MGGRTERRQGSGGGERELSKTYKNEYQRSVGRSPFWSLAVLESTDNSGARVHNSIFSDSYARAFMIKGRDSSFQNCTFRRAGGLHIGPEQGWLEGDPGISNVTVEENSFVSLPRECHR